MKDLIKEIVPPGMGPIARWRLSIFLCCSVFILFMGWSVSPWGFALAADFSSTRSLVKEVRMAQIEQYLIDAKEIECSSDNQAARKFYSTRVLTLNREYSIMAGIRVDIPPCPNQH